MRSPARRFVLAVVVLTLLTCVGTTGYVLIEGATLLDALYMTVITLSTVGYGEVVPLDPAGRVFTIGLIVSGVGTAFYLLTTAAELVLEGRLRDVFGRSAMQRTVERLTSHVILCGFGRFGRAVFEELRHKAMPMVVVDADPALEPDLVRAGVPYLIGSALSDEVLEHAGVERARAIVVATASDSDNVFITLSARERNPAIRIHARGESEVGLRRLRQAGADQVISAYQWGGMRMASAIVRPSVVDFMELSLPGRGGEMDLEEIRVVPEARIVGMTIAAAEQVSPRLRIVALKRGDDPIQVIPDATVQIAAGDHLVVVGDRDSLERLSS